MRAILHENKKFDPEEPFDGLFTQGMVCHETYKDPENNWVSPEKLSMGKYLKNNRKITVGASGQSKSKIQLILKILF